MNKQSWEIKKLGEVCEIINGFAFKSQLFKDCGDDILRISNIQNGVIDDSEIAHFSKEDYPKINFEKYAVLPDDIVVALSGATTGKFGVNNTGRKLYLNQRVAICREKTSKLHHLFLLYFLQTQSKSFLESAAGVAQPNLSTEQMKQYDIPVPPLPEQEKIVSELDCLSGIIEKKRQQLKELDALAQSIFYEMFGNPVDNERGWEVVDFECLCNSMTKGPFGSDIKKSLYVEKSEDAYKVYIQANAIEKDLSIGTYYISKEYFDEKMYRFEVHPYDYIITCDGTLGKFIRLPETIDKGIISASLLRLSIKEEMLLPQYFEFVWSEYMLPLLVKDVRNTALKHLPSASKIGKVRIPLPNIKIQREFAQKIEAIEQQKALIKQSIAEVETLFNSRMDFYFN